VVEQRFSDILEKCVTSIFRTKERAKMECDVGRWMELA
jgi:hypothetical protein